MTAHVETFGRIAPRSQPARMTVRGEVVQPTRTPIVQSQEMTNDTVQDDTAPTEQAQPVFTWSDETLGGPWDSSGNRHWNWSQSDEDWIRTGC